MRRQAGFTLIEVLLGIMLLALFVTLMQGIYAGTTRNREAARTSTEAVHAASASVQLMCDEFAMAFHNPDWIERTAFHLETDASENAEVEFTTRAPHVETLRVGGDIRVRYTLVQMKEERDRYILRRLESSDPFGDIERNATGYDMMEEVTHFKVLCYDGERWTDRWALADPQNPELPLAVSVEIGWAEGEGERVIAASSLVYRAP